MRNLLFTSAFIAQIPLTSTADAITDADSRLWSANDVTTYVYDVAALWDGIYIYVWQPVARGHRAYTDLSAARVRGPVLCTVCSLVNWEMTHMQPSDPNPLLTWMLRGLLL